MYLHSVLGYLSWPALIIASYYLVILALKHFDKQGEEGEGA